MPNRATDSFRSVLVSGICQASSDGLNRPKSPEAQQNKNIAARYPSANALAHWRTACPTQDWARDMGMELKVVSNVKRRVQNAMLHESIDIAGLWVVVQAYSV